MNNFEMGESRRLFNLVLSVGLIGSGIFFYGFVLGLKSFDILNILKNAFLPTVLVFFVFLSIAFFIILFGASYADYKSENMGRVK